MISEMRYKNQREQAEILAKDTYRGYEYVILSLGTHPCAYIILPKDNKLYGKDYDTIHQEYDISVHGGLTYAEDNLSFLECSPKYKTLIKSTIDKDVWVIGWDYAHSGDQYGVDSLLSEKRWTTQEIIVDCEDLINQILLINYEVE